MCIITTHGLSASSGETDSYIKEHLPQGDFCLHILHTLTMYCTCTRTRMDTHWHTHTLENSYMHEDIYPLARTEYRTHTFDILFTRSILHHLLQQKILQFLVLSPRNDFYLLLFSCGMNTVF